ncbi:ATP-dependent DNA helicase [Trypanosoma theileri]|uniref:DNA 3'-5' helicase n=1 Tax=Trypanosoma theileri TaxID=67003 RepID=A0A1X0NMQ1_9TRYP|nr:ATP-dependent DNA helicase [Trypanosoma theileri]ORC85996.1 ATP-dependent DNA helicase [Trypanosoma theileri]
MSSVHTIPTSHHHPQNNNNNNHNNHHHHHHNNGESQQQQQVVEGEGGVLNTMEYQQLLSALDASQRLAVCEDTSTPLLILAGAGSGKTLTMASRIAYMLLHGVAAENILGLCFSRQAAEALRERVAAVLPSSMSTAVRRLKLKTFHAFGLECLRRHGCIDLSTEVYDARRQRELAAAVVESHAVHYKGIEAVLGLIEYVNKAKTKKDMRAGVEMDPSRQSAYLFRFYQMMLHEQHHAVDFGDLEQMFLEALRPVIKPIEESTDNNNSNSNSNSNMSANTITPRLPSTVALHLRSTYTHIVVDEFQDLNEVQLECLALLAGDVCRVTCVGDPNQCIYTWRGATTNSFDRWRSRFPQTKLVRLETNYRSSAEIVNAVNEVTQLTQQSFRGQCGRRIMLIRCVHAWEELCLLPRVIEELLRTRDRGLQYSEIAILCRTRRRVREVIQTLEREQIPVCELRRSKPNATTLVRAMLSYLRLCVHPHSNLDVECVLRDAPHHFTAAAATKFIFALQAESLQRQRMLGTKALQKAESHINYSHYTILRELVHNGFAHVHERLRTTKSQQKMLRTFIEVTTAAHDALGRKYCDVEEVVRTVAERAGFDEGNTTGVKIRHRITNHNNNHNHHSNSNMNTAVKRERFSSSSTVRPSSISSSMRRSAGVWDDDHDIDEDENEDASSMSITQLLVEACRAVQQQVLAEKNTTSTINNNNNNNSNNSEESIVRDDAYTILQRVIDEFLALLPTDDFGPLKQGFTTTTTTTETTTTTATGPAAITVTTVHQAKGKEWPAVIVPGCYVGEFPIDVRSAEEKRVFYVAMSRAMRDLVFLTAERGPAAGRGVDNNNNNINNNDGDSEEQPLQITPYLSSILPHMETIRMSYLEQAQEEGKEEEKQVKMKREKEGETMV